MNSNNLRIILIFLLLPGAGISLFSQEKQVVIMISREAAYLPYKSGDTMYYPLPFLASSPGPETVNWYLKKALQPEEKVPDTLADRILFHQMMETSLMGKMDQNRIRNAAGSGYAGSPFEQLLMQHPDWGSLYRIFKPGISTDTLHFSDAPLQEACEMLWKMDEFPLAIRLAFHSYLTGREDSISLYLIGEGIRRMVFRQPGSAYKGFCSEGARSVLRTESILRDLRLLEPDSDRWVNRDFYSVSGAPLFVNYGEALEWILKTKSTKHDPELFLTAALWYYKNLHKRDSCLSLYLSRPGIRYMEFAKALMAGPPDQLLQGNTNRVTYLLPMERYIRSGKELIRSDSNRLRFAWQSAYLPYHKQQVVYLDDLRKHDQTAYERIFYFRKLCAGSAMEQVSIHEHCTGFILSQVTVDSAQWRKKSPFLFDPELWYWMRKENLSSVTFIDPYVWEKPSAAMRAYWYYIPPLYPLLIPRYISELKNGSGAHAFGVQSLKLDLRSKDPLQTSTETHWKRIRPSYFRNLAYYNAMELRDGVSKNRGFAGKKNMLSAEFIPIFHNGLYKLSYARSLGKHIMAEIGYGYISRRGGFDHRWTNSADHSQEEHFRFTSEGTTWTASVFLNSRAACVPAPAGLYFSAGMERKKNTFSEQADSLAEAFTYENRNFALVFTGGGNIMLRGGWLLDLGIRTGLQFGNVIPLNSIAAYRVPLRQYPDTWIWDRSDEFHYNLADDDVGGSGTNAFATFRLYYTRVLLYPVIRLGYNF